MGVVNNKPSKRILDELEAVYLRLREIEIEGVVVIKLRVNNGGGDGRPTIAVLRSRLENAAINDVLPLKAARRNAIANFKCFWASDTTDLISMVTFTFTMQRDLIRLG